MFDVLESCQTFPFYRPTTDVPAIQLFYIFMTLVFLIIAILVVMKPQKTEIPQAAQCGQKVKQNDNSTLHLPLNSCLNEFYSPKSLV